MDNTEKKEQKKSILDKIYAAYFSNLVPISLSIKGTKVL
jgi:hypothetical protein